MVRRHTNRCVGRPREFDEDAALEAAMDAFWRHGYEATSLADLCTCTGLHKGSLYQAFGDKHTLFMKSLQHYTDREFRETAAVAFNSDSPLENIRSVVREVCRQAGLDKGCLMINSLVELAPHDPEVRKLLNDAVDKRMRVMTEMLGKAQELGELRKELKPDMLARQLMIAMAGVAATVKGIIDVDEGRAVLENLIESWT